MFSIQLIGNNQSKIDSLNKALSEATEEKQRIKLHISLASAHKNHEPDIALKHAEIARDLSIEAKDEKEEANASNIIGMISYEKGNLERAIEMYESVIAIRSETADTFTLAGAYNNLGLAFQRMGDNNKALENHLLSYKYREAMNDKSGMAKSLHNIGLIYDYDGNQEKALEHYEKSLRLKLELNMRDASANTLSNIGTIYNERGEFDKALEYFLEAKDIYEHMKYSTNLAIILLNIGDVYRQKGDFELSKKYYLKIVKKLKEKNNRFIEAHTFISLGTLYNDMQEYGKAKSYLAKGLEDFKAMNSSPNVINSYEQLAKCYYGMKNYEAAYQINVAMQSLKDSLNDANNQKTLLEMQTQYETTEKEKEIELLSAENEIKDLALEQEQFVKAIAIGGIVILLIIATLLLIAFGIKQKSNQMLAEKNQIINKQNEDLAHQKQNIVDSINYAKKIQDSILVEETEIAKYIDDFFIYYKPRDIVSGDFYWFSNLGDKSVIAAVDCTGHGVPGAFMSMVGNSLLNEIVNVRGITKPSEILENLHVGVYTDLQQHQDGGGAQDGMDLSLCTIHHDSKKLEFAGAMNHLIVIRDGEIQSLKADLKHIGGRPRKREKDFRRTFTNHEIDLRENDCVYMLSDGYTDQFGGEQHKKFGSKSFKQLLLKYHEMKMAQQKKIYTDFMKDWKRDFNQMDDMLLIGMKF